MLFLNNIEKAFYTHEVAGMLNIGQSTLRKWCIELEANGYKFVKGENDSRIFLEKDISALKTFKHYLKIERKTKNEASKLVIEQFLKKQENEGTLPVLADNILINMQNQINELVEMNKNQEHFNRLLLERLEQQNEYIKDLIDRRDQLLLETIREQQNEKKKKNRLLDFFRKN